MPKLVEGTKVLAFKANLTRKNASKVFLKQAYLSLCLMPVFRKVKNATAKRPFRRLKIPHR